MKSANIAVVLGLTAVLGVSPSFAGSKMESKKIEPKETKAIEQAERKHDGSKKANDQAVMQKEAKISMEKAREIATRRAAGRIEDGELEREHGKLIYSFDIRNSKGTITEVAVSAIDGSIVDVKEETRAQETAEKKQDAKEKAALHKH